MQLDEERLSELLEESKETHADAMRATTAVLDDVVEEGRERRRNGEVAPSEGAGTATATDGVSTWRGATIGLGAAAGVGAAIAALGQTAAFASSASDIQILQTSQSIENLAIATYTLALTLPFIGGASANGVVKAFVKETVAQHRQHGAAFASAIRRLNGKPQTKPDPVLLKVVDRAKPSLTSAAAVVALALELEDGATQTYVASTAALKNANARNVTASIMGVEAQHVAILRAVQALLVGGGASLIALPPSPLTALPAAAGSVGFPNAFYPTTGARPAREGAL